MEKSSFGFHGIRLKTGNPIISLLHGSKRQETYGSESGSFAPILVLYLNMFLKHTDQLTVIFDIVLVTCFFIIVFVSAILFF